MFKNKKYTLEELIIIFRAMKTVCGLSRTEREALDVAIEIFEEILN